MAFRCRQIASWQKNVIPFVHSKGKHTSASISQDHAKKSLLRPAFVDYSVPPPIVFSPPPPPTKKGIRGFLPFFPLIMALLTTAYFYKYNKNDNFEFWEAMQSGKELPEEVFDDEAYEDDGDDDDDDDDDEL